MVNHYFISGVLTIATTAALGVFSLVRGWGKPVSRMFGIYTITICLWATGWTFSISSLDPWQSLLWGRLLLLPAVFIPPTFFHFTQRLLSDHLTAIANRLRWANYVLGLGFAVFAFHRYFVSSVRPVPDFKYYSEGGPLYFAFMVWFFIVVASIFVSLAMALRRESAQKKIKISYVLFAYFFGYVGGTMVFLPTFGHHQPKFALYTVPFAHVVLFYAIVRHRLLNVRIVLRRAALFGAIYGALLLLSIPAVIQINDTVLGLSENILTVVLVEAVAVGGLFSLGPFLFAYFVRRNSYFHEQTLAGLTHELKSPLASIEGALAVLNDRLSASGNDPSRSDYVSMIGRNTERLRQFIEELLLIFESPNQVTLQKEMVDVKSLVQSCASELEHKARMKGLTLTFSNSADELQTSCDPSKIQQVISNIVSNAVKFTDRGTIHISLGADEDELKVEVQDTGAGLRPNEIAMIFDRFYQGEAGRKQEGTGLGLTIAKAWVEAHGGKIWAESEGEGKGTKICFTLPLNT